MTLTVTSEQEAQRSRTVVWVVTLATIGLMFDGYDLVIYGTVVPIFLKDPSQIGEVTPVIAGTLGSYALIGVLVGALLAGSVGDIVGRRKVMLTAYAWFSIGMALTALTTTTTLFGVMRFLTGLGVGALVATTGALVAEIAPAGKKNLCNAITYSGVPAGSLLAALAAIILEESIGWRGMFLIGALPIITLLPLAFFKMPESVSWLVARGKVDKARAISERTGVPMPDAPTATKKVRRNRTRRLRRAVQPHLLAAHGADGIHERNRAGPGLLAEHLATGVDGARRVQRERFAVLPAGAQRWRHPRGAGRLPVR